MTKFLAPGRRLFEGAPIANHIVAPKTPYSRQLMIHIDFDLSNPVIVPPSRRRVWTLQSLTPTHGHFVLMERDDGHELPWSLVAVTNKLAARERLRRGG